MFWRWLGTALLLSGICLPAASSGAQLADFAGQYVLRIGSRNYLVLRIKVIGSQVSGTLSRPKRANFTGMTASHIGQEVVTESIGSAVLVKDQLRFTASNVHDPKGDQYDLTLLPDAHGSLQFVGLVVGPWTVTRVATAPALSVATDWDPQRSYFLDESENPNPEMQRIIAEDQSVRKSMDMSKADWQAINKQDAQHRNQVRDLLAREALHCASDFSAAAFVFQHGDTPEDYLLAHTLAMIAVARGDAGALWIATATLDRYLDSVNQAQIYGTQFHNTKEVPWTQEPYNRGLISDALRRQLGVPVEAEQQKQLDAFKAANQH